MPIASDDRETDFASEEAFMRLYLECISTEDFAEALQSLVGERAKGLSANVVCRLKEQWCGEYDDLGLWAALRKVFPETREQRCWVHKPANVLNKIPKSVQPKAKGNLNEIWHAETKEDADKAFDAFVEKFDDKYAAAFECLSKDRDMLLTFYDFPAEHWGHLRTTNPIESTFATIRLRHRKTKGSSKTESWRMKPPPN